MLLRLHILAVQAQQHKLAYIRDNSTQNNNNNNHTMTLYPEQTM